LSGDGSILRRRQRHATGCKRGGLQEFTAIHGLPLFRYTFPSTGFRTSRSLESGLLRDNYFCDGGFRRLLRASYNLLLFQDRRHEARRICPEFPHQAYGSPAVESKRRASKAAD
jgi:hypothetical protein